MKRNLIAAAPELYAFIECLLLNETMSKGEREFATELLAKARGKE